MGDTMGNMYSAGDIFQFFFTIVTCIACYYRGRNDGISQVVSDLIENGAINLHEDYEETTKL
jgi:hypothetical protein